MCGVHQCTSFITNTDGVVYARDAALSLIALLDVHPPLAVVLMHPPGGPLLTGALGTWYDGVLQVLEHQTQAPRANPDLGAACTEAHAALRRLLYVLLAHGVLDDPVKPLDAAAVLVAGPGPSVGDEAAMGRGAACVELVSAAQGPGDFRGALLRDCHAEQGLGNRMLLAHSHGTMLLNVHCLLR